MSNLCMKVFSIMFLLTDVKSLKEVVLKCGEFQQPTLALQTENDNKETESKLKELEDRISRLERDLLKRIPFAKCLSLITIEEDGDLLVMAVSVKQDFTSNLNNFALPLDFCDTESAYCLSVLEKAFAARKDCNDVAEEGFNNSGVYYITVGEKIIPVFCDMETDGGKWLVFQRRINGTQEFFLPWRNYTDGFGNIEHEFWLGLEYIHLITSPGSYQLRVDLEDWDGSKAYATYGLFRIGNSSTNYTLEIDGYNGTAGDAMSYNNNQQFSTYDRDNDRFPYSCVNSHRGGWWHSACTQANLNGRYRFGSVDDFRGLRWWHWKGNYSLKRAEMKIRRN